MELKQDNNKLPFTLIHYSTEFCPVYYLRNKACWKYLNRPSEHQLSNLKLNLYNLLPIYVLSHILN